MVVVFLSVCLREAEQRRTPSLRWRTRPLTPRLMRRRRKRRTVMKITRQRRRTQVMVRISSVLHSHYQRHAATASQSHSFQYWAGDFRRHERQWHRWVQQCDKVEMFSLMQMKSHFWERIKSVVVWTQLLSRHLILEAPNIVENLLKLSFFSGLEIWSCCVSEYCFVLPSRVLFGWAEMTHFYREELKYISMNTFVFLMERNRRKGCFPFLFFFYLNRVSDSMNLSLVLKLLWVSGDVSSAPWTIETLICASWGLIVVTHLNDFNTVFDMGNTNWLVRRSGRDHSPDWLSEWLCVWCVVVDLRLQRVSRQRGGERKRLGWTGGGSQER